MANTRYPTPTSLFFMENPMHDEDNHKPGKGLRPQQSSLPATLNTSKKLVQHLKIALAQTGRELAEDDGWVERLIRGLEAGINENTEIKAVIKTEDGEEEFDSLPQDKEIWLALAQFQFSGGGYKKNIQI